MISEDPAGLVDGPNRHAYVRNNPVRYIDPDGRQAQALPIIVICSPDPVTKTALIAAEIAAGVVIIWKACEDGVCFSGNKEPERDRNRRCDALYAADSEVCRRVKKRSCWAQVSRAVWCVPSGQAYTAVHVLTNGSVDELSYRYAQLQIH